MYMHLICLDCTDSFTCQCLTPGAQDDTEHLRNTCHSKFFLHLRRYFPCKQVPALVWSIPFQMHFRDKQKCFSHFPYIYNPTFSSPGVRHSYCCSLTFCVFACRSQPHQTMASCPVLHGRWVLRGGSSILYSDGREHSAPERFTCTNKNASICEKLLKNERAFPTINPNCPKVPSMLGCWDILEVKESVQTVLSSVNYLWPDLSLRQWLHAWKNMLIVE